MNTSEILKRRERISELVVMFLESAEKSAPDDSGADILVAFIMCALLVMTRDEKELNLDRLTPYANRAIMFMHHDVHPEAPVS